MLRSAGFLVQRYMLGRHTVLARAPAFDLELRVPARDEVGRNLYRDGMHKPDVTHLIATTLELEPDDLVFDIGASIGWYTMLLASVAPRGASIHAFEPDPWLRGLLQENVSRNRADTVTVIDAAAGETPGPGVLHRYGHRRRNQNGLLSMKRAEAVEIRMTSLDEHCRENELTARPVGFIKLDVKGFEFAVLRGARQTLGRCRAVLTEFSPARLQEADVHPATMLDLLVEHGFQPALLEGGELRDVSRAELLASDQECTLFWQRPPSPRPPRAPDPDAFAI